MLAEDVTGEEFEVFMSLLPRLKIMSSASAIEEMTEMVASQAGLTEEFQVIMSLSWHVFVVYGRM